MTPRQLDLAHQFCERVGKADLLDYLDLSADASSDEARAALKARRKKMQGMQSNAKFQDEARELIKKYSALEAVLVDPQEHVRDMARRREADKLPILEMTIKGVLAGGAPSPEQEAYLRKNALELGVSESAFDTLLAKLKAEAGTPPTPERTDEVPTVPPRSRSGSPAPVSRLPAGPPASPSRSARSRSKGPPDLGRLGAVVAEGEPPTPSSRLVKRTPASPSRPSPPVTPRPVPRRPEAHTDVVLTDAATAPPVRRRTSGPEPSTEQPTAPRRRSPPSPAEEARLDGGDSLQLIGPPRVDVEVVGRNPARAWLQVRLLGELPLAADVTCEDAWLTAVPSHLDPSRSEHRIELTIDPDKMFGRVDTTAVHIHNRLGDKLVIPVEATRKVNWQPLLLIGSSAGGLALVLAVVLLMGQWMATPGTAESLTVTVDPSAEAILVDGKKRGSGTSVVYEKPPTGEHTIEVVQHNFRNAQTTVTLEPGETRVVPIRLEFKDQDGPDYRPLPDDEAFLLPPDPKRQTQLRERLMGCLNRTPQGDLRYEGEVVIYLLRDGRAGGVHLIHQEPIPEGVASCLRRQAATLSYPALGSGDYARVNVRFKYP
jgi:hypothetical protein